MRRSSWLVFALLAALVVAAGAQKKSVEPKRPNVGADRNDPAAYYTWGLRQMEDSPEDAANAFYWAIRLDPGQSEYYYARWAALQLANPDRMLAYYEGDLKTRRSPDVQQMDSLMLRSRQLNPYLYMRFGRMLGDKLTERAILHRYPSMDQARLADAIRDAHSKGGPYYRAQNAYANGNFTYALQEYAAAFPEVTHKAFLHLSRARIFYMLGAYDSARAEFTTALGEEQKTEDTALVFIYDSKAVSQQSLGMIAEKLGNIDAAREAYGQALQEDLGYAPAHLAISNLDLAKHDTAAALSEMETATQVAPYDGYMAFLYGKTLLLAEKDQQALDQFKRAATLEPYYAEPHVFLAAIYDNAEYKDEARAEYSKFLELSSQKDGRTTKVSARLTQMRADSAALAARQP